MKLVSARILLLAVFILFLTEASYSQGEQKWSLEKCIDTAMVYNKKLQISRNNKQISQEKRKEVRGNLLPKIGINGEYKYFTDLPYQLMPMSVFGGPEGQFKEAQFGVPHNINANIQLTMPLYNPELIGNINTVKLAEEMSRLIAIKTEEQVYFEVSNLFYNTQILQHQLFFVDSNIVNSQALLNTVVLLHQQLLARETEVTKVQLQLEQLKIQKELLTAKIEQLLNGLKVMMGVALEREIEIDDEVTFISLSDDVVSKNINLQMAEKRTEMLQSEVKTIKHSRLPSLSLFGTYGTTGYGYDETPNEFLNFYPIEFAGIRLQYPLFSGNVLNKRISQKKLELNNAEVEYSLLQDQTTMELTNAKQQKQLSILTVENTLKQMKLAQKIYEQTVLQKKQGTANLTEVLMADNVLRESQQTYLTSIVAYLKSDLEIKKLSGNFLEK